MRITESISPINCNEVFLFHNEESKTRFPSFDIQLERNRPYAFSKYSINASVEKKSFCSEIEASTPKTYKSIMEITDKINVCISGLNSKIKNIVDIKELKLSDAFKKEKALLGEKINELKLIIKEQQKQLDQNSRVKFIENSLQRYQEQYVKEREINISLRKENCQII